MDTPKELVQLAAAANQTQPSRTGAVWTGKVALEVMYDGMMDNDRSTSSRTTERAIERAVLGVLAAGVEVGRVIVHSGEKLEITAARCDVRVGAT
jgi:hypothetical protein